MPVLITLASFLKLLKLYKLLINFFLLNGIKKAICQRKSSVQSWNRVNEPFYIQTNCSKFPPFSNRCGSASPLSADSVFTVYHTAKAPSPYHYFRACDKFQNVQPGTFRRARNYSLFCSSQVNVQLPLCFRFSFTQNILMTFPNLIYEACITQLAEPHKDKKITD